MAERVSQRQGGEDRAVDDDLAVRESTLPGLPVLLDDNRLTALLRQSGWLGHEQRATVDRIRLKPGTRAQAAARVDPGDRWLLLGAFSPHCWPKAENDRQATSRLRRPVIVDEELLLLVTDPVSDRDLPALRLLRPDEGCPRRRTLRALAAAAGKGVGADRLRVGTLAYNPARRWVGTLRAGNAAAPATIAVVKVHRDPRHGEQAAAIARALNLAGIATPHAVPLPHGIVAAPWVTGRHPDPASARDGAEVAGAVARLATLLGDTTAARGLDLPRLSRRDVLAGARAATTALVAVNPVAGDRARRVLAALTPALSGEGGAAVLVHGDLSADQVLITPGGVVLLDLDRAAAGPAGWDPACWLAAQAALGVPVEQLVALPETAVTGPLLAAAALLRAPEPWRRRRRGHAAATSGLLDLAELALAGTSPTSGAER